LRLEHDASLAIAVGILLAPYQMGSGEASVSKLMEYNADGGAIAGLTLRCVHETERFRLR